MVSKKRENYVQVQENNMHFDAASLNTFLGIPKVCGLCSVNHRIVSFVTICGILGPWSSGQNTSIRDITILSLMHT